MKARVFFPFNLEISIHIEDIPFKKHQAYTDFTILFQNIGFETGIHKSIR